MPAQPHGWPIITSSPPTPPPPSLCPAPQVNTDPFGEGWMIKVKLSNKSELDALMESGAYSAFCESGGH